MGAIISKPEKKLPTIFLGITNYNYIVSKPSFFEKISCINCCKNKKVFGQRKHIEKISEMLSKYNINNFDKVIKYNNQYVTSELLKVKLWENTKYCGIVFIKSDILLTQFGLNHISTTYYYNKDEYNNCYDFINHIKDYNFNTF